MRKRRGKSHKILITGGLGYIGFYLASLFKESGFSVRILDFFSRPDNVPQGVQYLRGDVTARGSWLRALEGVTHVVHLAAYGDNKPDFSKCFEVNVSGTALLYEVIRDEKLPVKQVILASSQSVYGEGKYKCTEHGEFYPIRRSQKDLESGRWDIRCLKDGKPAVVFPSEEDDKLLPVSPYGISKMAADHIAINIGRELGIPSVALRYSMVSGAYPDMRAIYPNAIKYFTEQALKNESVAIHEDGNQSRDFVDIRDLGRAHLAVLDNPASYYQAFNVGSGKSIKIRDLAAMVYKIVGAEFRPIYHSEFRPFTPRHLVMSIKKIEALGWRPAYHLEESIREYIMAVKKKTKKAGRLFS